jgi:hypothetical protein
MKKTKEQTEYQKKFIRSMEVSIMCVMNIYYRITEESKMRPKPIAIVTLQEVMDANNALLFVYKQTCNDWGIKIKNLEEINNSFQSSAVNE